MNPLFEAICQVIERSSSLTSPQARGLVRLVLKEAGVSHENLRAREARVVVERLLAARLEKNGVTADEARQLVTSVLKKLDTVPEPRASGPDAMFDRIDTYLGIPSESEDDD
ncbi:MAG: hypothetical protein AAFU77_06620 [Myxococcota bacterium]